MGAVIAESWTLIASEIALALVFATIAWFLGTITIPAAFGVAVLGATVLIAGGWSSALPLVVFFVTSVGLSHLPQSEPLSERSRSLVQVVANGAVAWLGALVLLRPDVISVGHLDAIHLYFGALAAANADTWATEIGTRYGGTPRDILNGQIRNQGSSGAVTSVGTIGATLGALAVACTYPVVAGIPLNQSLKEIGVITAAGLLGSVVDSFLGATVQVKYRCTNCGSNLEVSEHCGRQTKIMRGFISNDMVNLLCTLVGAMTAWIWIA